MNKNILRFVYILTNILLVWGGSSDEDYENRSELLEDREGFDLKYSEAAGDKPSPRESALIYYDFNSPETPKFKESIRKELDSQKEGQDETELNLFIRTTYPTKRDEFPIYTRHIHNSLTEFIAPEKSVKYLVEPRGKNKGWFDFLINVLITPPPKKLNEEMKAIENVTKLAIIPLVKQQYKNMNFIFESVFNAIDITTQLSSENTARVVIRVARKNGRIRISKVERILKQIKERYPQWELESIYIGDGRLGGDNYYLIISYHLFVVEDIETTTTDATGKKSTD